MEMNNFVRFTLLNALDYFSNANTFMCNAIEQTMYNLSGGSNNASSYSVFEFEDYIFQGEYDEEPYKAIKICYNTEEDNAKPYEIFAITAKSEEVELEDLTGNVLFEICTRLLPKVEELINKSLNEGKKATTSI